MPIIGSGDIARVIPDRDSRLFFASGVSNSRETRETEYQREKELLKQQGKDRQIVYFGSLSIFYACSRYTEHKQEMESLVKEFPAYAILRIGNIDWGTNPHILINHLKAEKEAGKPLEIQDVYRYVITKNQLVSAIENIPDGKYEINLWGNKMKVKDIVELYCN